MSYKLPDGPVVQLALDFLNTDQALRAATEAVQAGPVWLEAGTPLIKSEGLEIVRRLRAGYPEATLVADMKVMDAGRVEVEAAHKAGADLVIVMGAAADATVAECVETGRHLGVRIGCDLLGVADPVGRARQVEALGVDLVNVHTPIDQQMTGELDFGPLTAVAAAVAVPVSCAGGINAANAGRAVAAGARIVVVGGAITKAPSAREATAALLAAVSGEEAAASELYQRVGVERIREVLMRVSTPNLSDAMHRGGMIDGLFDRNPGVKFCGPARTVVSAPGDWSKPVQAIDSCEAGDVLVIDAAGRLPALWGGLATRSALNRGVVGILIHGACRDVEEITGSELGCWTSLACPAAGEPKGVGHLGDVLRFGGQTIQPGDWIVADRNGPVVIPATQVVAVGNRAQDVMEREQRYMAEIAGGETLAGIVQLDRWESAG